MPFHVLNSEKSEPDLHFHSDRDAFQYYTQLPSDSRLALVILFAPSTRHYTLCHTLRTVPYPLTNAMTMKKKTYSLLGSSGEEGMHIRLARTIEGKLLCPSRIPTSTRARLYDPVDLCSVPVP